MKTIELGNNKLIKILLVIIVVMQGIGLYQNALTPIPETNYIDRTQVLSLCNETYITNNNYTNYTNNTYLTKETVNRYSSPSKPSVINNYNQTNLTKVNLTFLNQTINNLNQTLLNETINNRYFNETIEIKGNKNEVNITYYEEE